MKIIIAGFRMKYLAILLLIGCFPEEGFCPDPLTPEQCDEMPDPPESVFGDLAAIELTRLWFEEATGVRPGVTPTIRYENRVERFQKGDKRLVGRAWLTDSGCEVWVIVDEWTHALPHETLHCFFAETGLDEIGAHEHPAWAFIEYKVRAQIMRDLEEIEG